MVRAVGILLLVVVAAAGCDTGVTVGPKLAKDQVLRVMLEDQPASLDPGQTQYTYETAVLRAISEPLLRPNADLSGVPPAAAPSFAVNPVCPAYICQLRSS